MTSLELAAFRPFRAWISFAPNSQGVALGYRMSPRWGFEACWDECFQNGQNIGAAGKPPFRVDRQSSDMLRSGPRPCNFWDPRNPRYLQKIPIPPFLCSSSEIRIGQGNGDKEMNDGVSGRGPYLPCRQNRRSSGGETLVCSRANSVPRDAPVE